MQLRMLRHGRFMVTMAALLSPLPALAQSVPPPPPAQSPPPSAQAAQDQRINALQAQLHITPAQQPQWNAFAQAMRDNATKTDAMFRQRAGSATKMTALENMQSYAQIARAYADATEALAEAFASLYAVLSDQQKQTIDGIFRQDATKNASATTMKP